MSPLSSQDIVSLLSESGALLSAKLHASAKIHASIALSIFNQGNIADPLLHIRINVALGHASFGCGEIKRATTFYESAMSRIRGHFPTPDSGMDPVIVDIIESMLENISLSISPDLAISWALSIPANQRSDFTLMYICRHGATRSRLDACQQFLLRHPTAEEVLTVFFQLGGSLESLESSYPAQPVPQWTRSIWNAIYAEYKCMFHDANTFWASAYSGRDYELNLRTGRNFIRTLDVHPAWSAFAFILRTDSFGIWGMDWAAIALYEAGRVKELYTLKERLDSHASDSVEAKTVHLVYNTIMKSWADVDVQKYPEPPSTAYSLALAQSDLCRGNYASAQKRFTQLKSISNTCDLLVYRGVLESICEQIPLEPNNTSLIQIALILTKTMQKKYSSVPEATYIACRVLLASNSPSHRDGALKTLHNLIKSRPASTSAIQLLARSYTAAKLYDQAVAVIEEAQGCVPKYFYWFELAQVYIQQGNKQMAIKALTRVQPNEPDHRDAARQLKELYSGNIGDSSNTTVFNNSFQENDSNPSTPQPAYR